MSTVFRSWWRWTSSMRMSYLICLLPTLLFHLMYNFVCSFGRLQTSSISYLALYLWDSNYSLYYTATRLQHFIESFELEGTCKGHLVQLPSNEQGHLHQVLRAQSSLTFSVSRNGASTTSVSKLSVLPPGCWPVMHSSFTLAPKRDLQVWREHFHFQGWGWEQQDLPLKKVSRLSP